MGANTCGLFVSKYYTIIEPFVSRPQSIELVYSLTNLENKLSYTKSQILIVCHSGSLNEDDAH